MTADFPLGRKIKIEDNVATSLKYWGENSINLKFFTQQKYLSMKEGKMNPFPDKQKLEESITSNLYSRNT